MIRVTLIAAMLVAAGCSRRGQQAAPPRDSATTTPTAAATPPSAVPPVAAAAQPQAALGHLMAGAWDISPTGVVGPHLSITVDSARGPAFFGRLTRVVAGDVLLDVDRFEPFVGVIGPDSVVRVTVNWREKGPPPGEFVGTLSGGAWRLSRFVWGGEEQVIMNRTWTGRRVT